MQLPKNKKFIRKTEDFTCEKCGVFVKGNGYTNHCHNCLWSKHVDIHPGDRANLCLGLMEPVRIEGSTGKYRVLHRCTVCKFEKYNSILDTDSIDTILAIIAKRAKDFTNQK